MSAIVAPVAVDTTAVEAVAPAVAKVLRAEGIISTSSNEKWNDFEEEAFVRAVVSYAKEGAPFGYLELTYTASNTRLIIKVDFNGKREAGLSAIDAYDHPYESDAIDYEALSLKLQQAAGISE